MSNEPKQPKKLDLTEPTPKKPESGGEGASLPVSIELNQRRSQYYQDFENSLRQARIELKKHSTEARLKNLCFLFSRYFRRATRRNFL